VIARRVLLSEVPPNPPATRVQTPAGADANAYTPTEAHHTAKYHAKLLFFLRETPLATLQVRRFVQQNRL